MHRSLGYFRADRNPVSSHRNSAYNDRNVMSADRNHKYANRNAMCVNRYFKCAAYSQKQITPGALGFYPHPLTPSD